MIQDITTVYVVGVALGSLAGLTIQGLRYVWHLFSIIIS